MPIRSAIRILGPVLCGAALLLAGCGPKAPLGPALTRLLPALGQVTYLDVADETRPATLLRPGETRSCTVTAPRGSRLRFWIGFDDPPDAGAVQITVTVAGAEVCRRVFTARSKKAWHGEDVPLQASGPVTIAFAVRRVREDGAPFSDAAGQTERPWVALGSPRLSAPAPGKPRVLVWISQDTLRSDHLSANGYAGRTTPTLERLSQDWVVFEDALATAPWTLPSLASQFTGRYPSSHGAVHKSFQRDPGTPTLFEVLAAHGFTVLGATGNSFVSADFGMAQGFDGLWYAEGRAEGLNHRVKSALQEWDGGDLALFVHYMDPHYAYVPPEPYDRMFDPAYAGTVDGVNFRRLGLSADPADLAHVQALYDGEIAYADAAIEKLLARLRARGLLEDAVVLYTGDHGDEFLEHGGWYHGHTLYQELLHVPLALHVPGLSQHRVRQPVSMIDIAPTVLEAFGIAVPPSFQGESLLGLLKGRGPHQALLFAENQNDHAKERMFAVREGNLKYVATVTARQAGPARIVREELYDLAADPRETRNLIASAAPQKLRERARRYIENAETSLRTPRRAAPTPEAVERLKALGYVD